jgi:hypothetical protein
VGELQSQSVQCVEKSFASAQNKPPDRPVHSLLTIPAHLLLHNFFRCWRRGTVEEAESYHTLPPCSHCIGKGKVTPLHTINTNWGLAV